ncbi:hypothetical protein FPV67DRAFT_1667839 [Lyophyllum atratum]|nr:hypothetical protein FPV67DRAFT_1667839 [Lyophyllum atratum]
MVSTSAASTHFIQFCIQWSSLALLYYDYVLTFGMEVKYIWKQKFRISTVLYICCRYALVANVVYLLTISNKITGKYDTTFCRCRAGYLVSSALSVFGRAAVIVGGLLAIMMVVFEILSAGLTTMRTIQAMNVNGPWWKQKKGLNYLIFEQGILYFCSVTVLTIASLALNITIPGGFLQRLLNAYTIPLSGLMTARFLLHIRKWEGKRDAFRPSDVNGEDDEHGGTGTSTNLDFASRSGSRTLNSGMSSEPSEEDHEQEREARSTSFMDEFGEDPVRRARARGSVSIDIGRGAIVEELRV